MSTESPTILVVDDDADIVKAARLLLGRHGMAAIGAADPAAAWAILAEQPIDVIMLDLNFARGRTSGEEGFAMLDRLVAADRDTVVVVVTGHSGLSVAVQAMRGGASDFVIKPWNNERLLATIDKAVALRRARRAGAPMPAAGEDRLLIGDSAAFAGVRDLIARVAPTEAAVLIRGPAGSGKSLVARMIHQASARADQPMIVFDSDAEVPTGTLLIEDADTLDRDAQRRLARSLDGVRVIATSRCDRAGLRAALTDDLLFRLNTIEIDLPPLAERRDDALLLARHFLARFAGRHGKPAKPLTDEAARAIAADTWPDDVRGLRQAMERAVLLGGGDVHDIGDFALSVPRGDTVPRAIATSLNLSQSERMLVEAALKRHAFNVSHAAAELGLTRAALYRRMAKHGL